MLDFMKSAPAKPEETAEKQSGAPEFKAIEALAAKALMLADAYQTPPIPKTYAVWYSYAAGVPEEVAAKINGMIEKSGSIGPYELDQVHQEYLLATEQDRKHQELLSRHLDREMAEIAKLVQGHLTSSENYSGSLKNTATSLDDRASPAQVRTAIQSCSAKTPRCVRKRSSSTKA